MCGVSESLAPKCGCVFTISIHHPPQLCVWAAIYLFRSQPLSHTSPLSVITPSEGNRFMKQLSVLRPSPRLVTLLAALHLHGQVSHDWRMVAL